MSEKITIPVSIIADDGRDYADRPMGGSVDIPLDLHRHFIPGDRPASVRGMSQVLAPGLRPEKEEDWQNLLDALSILADRAFESMRGGGRMFGNYVLQLQGGRTFLSTLRNWQLQAHVVARHLRFGGGVHTRMSEHRANMEGLSMIIDLEAVTGTVELDPEIWAFVYAGMPQDQKDKLVAEAWSRLASNDAQHLLNVRETGIQTHAELSMAREVSEWLIDLSSRRWHARK